MIRSFSSLAYLAVAGLLLLAISSCTSEKEADPPNVLFIFLDDLNDWALHPEGHPETLVPNMDKLARQSVSFSNAHVSIPVCGPSRKSLFSGLYPHTLNDYFFDAWSRSPVLDKCVALPKHFRDNGYLVYGAGKLLHEGQGGDFYTEYGYGVDYGPFPWKGIGPIENTPFPAQMEQWLNLLPLMDMHRDLNYSPLSNVPSFPPDPDGEFPGADGWYYSNGDPFRYENDAERDLLPDELVTEYALEVLSREHHKPFFLTVGLVRTHTPLYTPKEYFDRFALEEITLPPYLENDKEDCALTLQHRWEWGYTKFDALIGAGGEQAWKEWVQAYLACIAFVDDQVGRILDALEESPYKDNTVIVFSSDHGYHIGEKDCIQKWHLWNESTRVPLMIKIPKMRTAGQQVQHPVSLLDLYPTLADLCGLPPEPHQPMGGPALDGYSLRPFLENPATESWEGPPVCMTAIRGPQAGLFIGDTDEDPHFSVCSERYRYTFCANGEEELYDHLKDPHEWTNQASNQEYRVIKAQLRTEMHKILEKGGYAPKHPSSINP